MVLISYIKTASHPLRLRVCILMGKQPDGLLRPKIVITEVKSSSYASGLGSKRVASIFNQIAHPILRLALKSREDYLSRAFLYSQDIPVQRLPILCSGWEQLGFVPPKNTVLLGFRSRFSTFRTKQPPLGSKAAQHSPRTKKFPCS